jgi:hypothetical protein
VPDASVDHGGTSGVSSFGDRAYRLNEPGVQTLWAELAGDDASLVEVALAVGDEGPAVRCVEPRDGSMIVADAGAPLDLVVEVERPEAVVELTVAGDPVTMDDDGTARAVIRPVLGVNYVAVDARGEGEVGSRALCSFVVAPAYAPEDEPIDDVVRLDLAPRAIDDRTDDATLNSLADLFRLALNSQGFRDVMHESLGASNPLKPMSCDQEICLFGCTCIVRSEIRYRQTRFGSRSTVTLAPIADGLRAEVRIPDLSFEVDLAGTIDNRGWVDLSHVSVDVEVDLHAVGGRPRVAVRRVRSVGVGDINLRFGGISGLVIDIVEGLFEGKVRTTIEDAVRGFVEGDLGALLDGLVSSLDVSPLATDVEVPRPAGGEPLSLRFDAGFSSLRTTASGAVFGLGLGATTVARHARVSAGVVLASDGRARPPAASGDARAAVDQAFVNAVLHALWRGGFFDGELGAAVTGSEGTTLQIASPLPPTAEIDGGQVHLRWGGLRVALTAAGLFDVPLEITLGTHATADVRVVDGEELSFGELHVEEVTFASETYLPAALREAVAGWLEGMVQRVLDEAVSGGLPSFPVPSFTLPDAVGEFGLPAGRRLGLVDPRLSVEPGQLALTSRLGVL